MTASGSRTTSHLGSIEGLTSGAVFAAVEFVSEDPCLAAVWACTFDCVRDRAGFAGAVVPLYAGRALAGFVGATAAGFFEMVDFVKRRTPAGAVLESWLTGLHCGDGMAVVEVEFMPSSPTAFGGRREISVVRGVRRPLAVGVLGVEGVLDGAAVAARKGSLLENPGARSPLCWAGAVSVAGLGCDCGTPTASDG